MKINKEEVKRIIDDLILNRDSEIKEFNEKLYSNIDYTEFLKRGYSYNDISDTYQYATMWRSYI